MKAKSVFFGTSRPEWATVLKCIMFAMFSLFACPLYAQDRIISLKPNITDILLRLGAGDELVGVTTYCTLPPGLKNLPRVADYIKPNLEKVLAQKPTLVLSSKENSSREEIETLARLGLRVGLVSFRSIADIYQSIAILAGLVHRDREGQMLVQGLKGELLALQKQVSALGAAPRLLFVVGQNPLVASGHRNLFQEFFDALHLDNVLKESTLAYPRVSAEALVRLDPEWIVDASAPEPSAALARYYQETFPTLKAVVHHHVIILPAAAFLPGPPLWEGFARIVMVVRQNRYQ